MKLQTLTANGWKYVFCRVDARALTTEDKTKALPACALPYFERHCANSQFRVA